MRIGIDLDGVVFNTEMLWAVYSELYDINELKRNSVIKEEEPRVQEKYDWSEEEVNGYLNKYIDITDFDMMPGAKEVIDLLKKDGHKLFVISARGGLCNSKRGMDIARDRLEKEEIIFDNYFFNQLHKVEICKEEKIDIMIDDNYHICEALSKEKIKSIYLHSLGRKMIENDTYIKQVTNWGEIYRYICEISKNDV